jgi:hypothetical protein|tara:strand:+ start:351 stop:494 length:144 start_codon:yes stop_codon:yes gene_type:complete
VIKERFFILVAIAGTEPANESAAKVVEQFARWLDVLRFESTTQKLGF